MHIFEFKGKTFWVNHHVGETLITGWERMPTEMEELTIMTWGNDTSYIKDFIDACVVHNMKTDKNHINIYELHHWGIGWTKVQSKKPSQEKMKNAVINELKTRNTGNHLFKFNPNEVQDGTFEKIIMDMKDQPFRTKGSFRKPARHEGMAISSQETDLV